MAEEITLLQASLDGDTAAFEKLVCKYQSLVCAITFSGTARQDISEELAQETFLSAWRNLRQLKDLHGFRAWLCTIARNTLKNYYRSKKPVYMDVSALDDLSEPAPTPDEALCTREELAMLERALLQIPDEYREPLVMYYRQHKSTRQVADALELNESTVRTRLHRARHMLRDRMADRLEQTLEQTAPGRDFTRTVMVAVTGAAIGLSAASEAAATADTAAAASSALPAAMSALTAKILTVTAVVTVVVTAAVLYTRTERPEPISVPPEKKAVLQEPRRLEADAEPQDILAMQPEPAEKVTEAQSPDFHLVPLKADIPAETPAVNEPAILLETKTLPETPESVFEPNGVLSGRITDIETGQPVTDAEITITSDRRYSAKTDETGLYHVDSIEQSGDYTVAVYSNEYVGVTVYSEQPRLHLKPTSQTVRHFQLPKACMVNVYVMGEDHKPIKDVRIWTSSLADEHGIEVGRPTVSRRTDENGYIQIGGFKPSQTPYMIHALHAHSGDWVNEAGKRYREQFYDYAPGYAKIKLTDPDIIEYAQIVLPKGESVQGFARYTDGTPAAECKIVPYPDWWHSNRVPPGFDIDPNGLFTLEQILPGTYRIQASVPSGPSSSTGYTLFSVHLPEEKEKLLTLTIPRKPANEGTSPNDAQIVPKLYGMVVDAATGKPIPKFRLRYKRLGLSHISAEGKWTQFEDENGGFTMDTTLRGPAVCQIQAVADRCAPQWSSVIDTNENQAVLIKLSSGGSITGIVEDAEGDPVADATVLPHSLAGDVLSRNEPIFDSQEGAVTTDAKGRFTMNNVAPGVETLKITHRDFADTLVSDVMVQQAKQNDLGKIILNKGGTIEGFVYDNRGIPQGGVTLFAQNHYGFSSSEIQYAQVVTEPNGFYQIQNLPDAVCYIVRPRGYEQNGVISRAAIPPANQTTRLDIGGGPVITGRLVIDGRPVANARMTLGLGNSIASGLHHCYTQTDDDGQFAVMAGSPGIYSLSYDRFINGTVTVTTKLLDIEVNADDEIIEAGTLPSMRMSMNVWMQGSDERIETVSAFYVRQNDPDEGPVVFWAEDPNAAQMPYTISLPGAGKYYAVLRGGSGYCDYQYPIEIKPDQTTVEMTIPLSAGPVTLVGSLPELINHVRYTNEDKTISGFLFNDPQTGGFSINHLFPGTYYFCPKWANWQGSIVRTIPNTAEFKLDVELAQWQEKLTERLTVYVFGPDGLPVRNAAVWVQTGGQKRIPVYGDEYSGVFYLPQGQHGIHAEKDGWQGTKTYQITIDPYSTASGESCETYIQLSSSDGD